MQTLGDLIDQLATVNIKLFMNQEAFQDGSYKEMDKEELMAQVERSTILNTQRNRLIDEINTKLAKIIKGEEQIEFSKFKTK